MDTMAQIAVEEALSQCSLSAFQSGLVAPESAATFFLFRLGDKRAEARAMATLNHRVAWGVRANYDLGKPLRLLHS
jgi:hypothetical protein